MAKLKLSLTHRPEAWHTVSVPAGEDGSADVRVMYWLLPESEVRRIRREPLERYERDGETQSNIAALVDALSDERADERRTLLIERIKDWDIVDADTDKPLALKPETIKAVCEIGPLFVALYDGLLEASSSPIKKT